MNEKIYEYDEIIRCIPEKGRAHTSFSRGISEKNSQRAGESPCDEFDGQPYDG